MIRKLLPKLRKISILVVSTYFVLVMNQELLRLATFSSWPETAKASPVRLAKAGLYFNGQGDTTVCFRCSSLLDKWKEGDSPEERHRNQSSNCPLVLGNDSENKPLQLSNGYSDSILTNSHHDGLDTGDTVSNRKHCIDTKALLAVYNNAIARTHNNTELLTNSEYSFDRANPDFDRLCSESVRLSTFHDWPPRAHAQPAELVREGFFFTGLDDRVQCAFCRGFLRNWVPGDKVEEEHKKHFPECPLVRGLVGNVLNGRQNHLTEVTYYYLFTTV